MKKRFFIPACVLVVAAIGFVIYAAGHPELSFPWSIQITHILYGLYLDAVVLLFVLAIVLAVKGVKTIVATAKKQKAAKAE